MVIQTSNVAMRSENRMACYKAESVSYSGWGKSVSSAENISALPTATDSAQTEENNKITDTTELYENMLAKNSASKLFESSENSDSVLDKLTNEQKVEVSSLESLMSVFSRKLQLRKITPRQLFEDIFQQMKERANALYGNLYSGAQGLSSAGITASARSATMTVKQIEKSVEKTSFSSSGTVKTADGREIEFDMSFECSSSFTRETSVEIDYTEVYMMDPLVINLSDNVTEVSDQHFYFDLDCDGEEDNISLLTKACGFLALDKNEDGIINDGSELFGALTGDGFKELAVFDLDGNGWIDENDEVFNHLKIWKKNDDGTDELVGLGVAGIGAIYLGNVDTSLTLRGTEGSTLGAVRETGIYLNEDGTAGTIQHVDLAIA